MKWKIKILFGCICFCCFILLLGGCGATKRDTIGIVDLVGRRSLGRRIVNTTSAFSEVGVQGSKLAIEFEIADLKRNKCAEYSRGDRETAEIYAEDFKVKAANAVKMGFVSGIEAARVALCLYKTRQACLNVYASAASAAAMARIAVSVNFKIQEMMEVANKAFIDAVAVKAAYSKVQKAIRAIINISDAAAECMDNAMKIEGFKREDLDFGCAFSMFNECIFPKLRDDASDQILAENTIPKSSDNSPKKRKRDIDSNLILAKNTIPVAINNKVKKRKIDAGRKQISGENIVPVAIDKRGDKRKRDDSGDLISAKNTILRPIDNAVKKRKRDDERESISAKNTTPVAIDDRRGEKRKMGSEKGPAVEIDNAPESNDNSTKKRKGDDKRNIA